MASTLTASLFNPAPAAVRGLGCSKLTAQPLCLPAPHRAPRLRAHVTVRAQQQPSQAKKPEVAQFADSIGLPTDEGIFGFKPFSEVWVGRLAMMGFLTSIVEEAITGRGTLQQIGLLTPSPVLVVFLCLTFGGATVFAFGRTLKRALSKDMTAAELLRYRQFLGIQKEQQNIAETEREMKDRFRKGEDFTAPDIASAIQAAKAAETPIDGLLNWGDRAEADREAAAKHTTQSVLTAGSRGAGAEPGPNVSLAARADVVEQGVQAGNRDWDYARSIEITNGRWAMLGFLTATIVEAATGQGILGQLIGYGKLTGLLGPASGF